MKYKKIIICSFFSIMSVFSFAKPKGIIVECQEVFSPTKENRKIGYQFTGDDKIVFIFDSDIYEIENPNRVFVRGSFNGWAKHNIDWELNRLKGKIWTLEVSAKDINIPGTLGFPEFGFYSSYEEDYIETVCGMNLERKREVKKDLDSVCNLAGFTFNKKKLILPVGTDSNEVQKKIEKSKVNKKLKDYDFENPGDLIHLTNFRKIPGTKNIFRGSHPYKLATENNTEEKRLYYVNKQIKENKINSIVSLIGKEQIDSDFEQISIYVREIQENQNQIIINMSDKTTTSDMSSIAFGKVISSVVRFINQKEGPFYIHCNLGDDKTGAVCAVISALCGQSWSFICTDFEESNEMGVNNYHSALALQFGFEKMLDSSISEIEDLQKVTENYFVQGQFLKNDEIKTFVEKVKE